MKFFLFLTFFFFSSCSSTDERALFLGSDRPARIVLPSDYNPSKSYPLLTLLHGFSSNADSQNDYLGMGEKIDSRQFILLLPEGKKDSLGQQYWNATDGCCDFEKSEPDDASYLIGLVEEAIEKYAIDERRVYYIGHSNGGFMSHTMACKYSEKIAAIASLSGTTFLDETQCQPTASIGVLQMHGTLDPVISYKGASSNFGLNGYLGAEKTVERWAQLNACAGEATNLEPINISTLVPGKETQQRRWVGCDDQVDVQLWTIEGGTHLPSLSSLFSDRVLDFLLSHHKP